MFKNTIDKRYNKPIDEPDRKIFFYFFLAEKEYLAWLEAHGRRPRTIETTRYTLDAIGPRLIDLFGELTFEDIGEQEILMLIDDMAELTERTRHLYLCALGRLIGFATGRDPMKNIGIMWNHNEPTRRIFIDEDDWPKIKKAAKTPTDRLILSLGAYMGLRREEMVRIKLTDIQDNILIIRGKGHGPEGRIVSKEMPQPVIAAVNEYMRVRARMRTDSDRFLIHTEGKRKGHAFTSSSIRYAIDNMSAESGVRFTCHSLRRLYATSMYKATGGDIVQTQRATRHKSADVLINCYIKADPSQERAAVDRMLQMI